MKKTIIAILAFFAVSFSVQAQDAKVYVHGSGTKGGKEPKVYTKHIKMSRGIPDLTDEQEEQIKALKLAKDKDNVSISNQLAEKRARLTTLKAVDKADMSAINKTIDEISTLQAQQMKADAAYHVKVRALLTDEQKVAFDSKRNRTFHYSFGGDDGLRLKGKAFNFGDSGFNFDFNKLGELNSSDWEEVVL